MLAGLSQPSCIDGKGASQAGIYGYAARPCFKPSVLYRFSQQSNQNIHLYPIAGGNSFILQTITLLHYDLCSNDSKVWDLWQQSLRPSLADNPRGWFVRCRMPNELVESLMDGLRKGGLGVGWGAAPCRGANGRGSGCNGKWSAFSDAG